MYSKEVMEHFQHPHNMGEIKNPDGVGTVGNPQCGDVMKIFIKVEKGKDGKERLKDIKVQTYGCVAALATSSMITDLAMGKTLDEALKISNKQIAEALKGLPPIKMHCSVLAADALHSAIEDYRKKGARRIQPKESKAKARR
ncbi:MAG: Fe-S cluster assembly scaffold protein NifU [Candidatus Aenigmarchaeota archaeon]|nr:Fe-S cluster assembly scaffold protein NifU [Candidatus Aenigmarchaeota archaeon]